MPPIKMCSQRVMKGMIRKRKVDNHLDLVNKEAIVKSRVVKPGDRVWTQASSNTWRGGVVLDVGIKKSAPNAALDAMEVQDHVHMIYFNGYENPAVLSELAWFSDFMAVETDEKRAENLMHAQEAIDNRADKVRKVNLWRYKDTITGVDPPKKPVAKSPGAAIKSIKKSVATKSTKKSVATKSGVKPPKKSVATSHGATLKSIKRDIAKLAAKPTLCSKCQGLI
jgi:hypothetical protein